MSVVLGVAVAVSGCYRSPNPTEYGANARAYFVSGCTSETKAKDGTTSTVVLASKSSCTCVYEAISDSNGKNFIKWDDLKAYEDKVNAANGSTVEQPKRLARAISDCKELGPVAPSTSTTTTTGA
jgi:hypothetical protein